MGWEIFASTITTPSPRPWSTCLVPFYQKSYVYLLYHRSSTTVFFSLTDLLSYLCYCSVTFYLFDTSVGEFITTLHQCDLYTQMLLLFKLWLVFYVNKTHITLARRGGCLGWFRLWAWVIIRTWPHDWVVLCEILPCALWNMGMHFFLDCQNCIV